MERFLVSDLLRDPEGFVGSREIPPGPREQQIQELALTIRECVAPSVWNRGDVSMVVDGETLVVHADAAVLDEVRCVLAQIRGR